MKPPFFATAATQTEMLPLSPPSQRTLRARPPASGASGRRALGLVTILAICGTSMFAQTPPQETFEEAISVRLRNLEVVVTDRSGAPVTGLTKDDFAIEVDGEPVTITHFAAYGEEPQFDSEEARQYEGRQDRRPHLIVVIDSLHSRPSHRRRVIEQLQEEIPDLLTASRGLMVVDQAEHIRVEEKFTKDVAAINAAFERILKKRSASPALTGRQVLMTRIRTATVSNNSNDLSNPSLTATADTTPETLLESIRLQALLERNELFKQTRQVVSFARSLAGLEGRKAVLYISPGFDTRPGELLFRLWWDKFQNTATNLVTSIETEINNYDSRDDLLDLISEASTSGATFYTLDSAGTEVAGLGASQGDITAAGLLRQGTFSLQESLVQLASGTGGTSLVSSGGVGSLTDSMRTGFFNYYSIGFPAQKADDSHRRVKVKLKDDNPYRLRYLTRYRARGAGQQLEELTLAALLFDVVDNPLSVAVELGEPQRQKRKEYHLSMLVKVPIGQLDLLPIAEKHSGRFSVAIAVQDEDGGLSDTQLAEVPIEINNQDLLKAIQMEAGYTATLAVRPGTQKIAIGVRDDVGQQESTVSVIVDVGTERDKAR